MENPLFQLYEAEKTVHSLERLMYLTYPILKEKTIALKSIRDLKKAVGLCIRAVLQREKILKRIMLSNNPKKNLHKFFLLCTPRYQITPEEKASIIEILKLNKKHQESVMEFKRKEELVIISSEMEYQIINEQKLKDLIKITKTIVEKVKEKMRN